jgi:hypothetical protein
MSEPGVKVPHRVHIERHNPVVCVNEVLFHPHVYIFRMQFKLNHEREQKESEYVVSVSVLPDRRKYIADDRNMIECFFV